MTTFKINGKTYTDDDLLVCIPSHYKPLFEGHEFPNRELFSRALMFAGCAAEARYYNRMAACERDEAELDRVLLVGRKPEEKRPATPEYRKTRKPLLPILNEWYTNEGGGVYKCLRVFGEGDAIMRNISSGWTLHAHGLSVYEDGRIDWDYSTGLGFYELPV